MSSSAWVENGRPRGYELTKLIAEVRGRSHSFKQYHVLNTYRTCPLIFLAFAISHILLIVWLFTVATSRFYSGFALIPVNMFSRSLASLLLLPAALRGVLAQNSTSGTACNNSPQLCDRRYDLVTYLGAHDSMFLRDDSTGFSSSGNQFYNSTVQLSAGVRLLQGQIQTKGNALHLCHTSCDLLDAGPLSTWLSDVRSWMDSNPNEVVTILLVNGPNAAASEIAAQYSAAGITSDLAYTPSGSSSEQQTWPTLQSMINDGTRLVNFVQGLTYDSTTPWLMDETTYIFENSYQNSAPTAFTCAPSIPSNIANQTSRALSDDLMPLQNHFLYENLAFGIQQPNQSYVTTTNAPSGGVGNLGDAAAACRAQYGRAPTYLLVDFFNVGPAIATADRMNGVTNPVGRTRVSTQILTESSGAGGLMPNAWILCLTALLGFWVL